MIKELVVSREMGQKLKAAGWSRQTAFIYDADNLGPWPLDYDAKLGGVFPSFEEISKRGFVFYPAPTAEEILRELPSHFILATGIQVFINIWKWREGMWQICYRRGDANTVAAQNKSLSEAAAQMWLWCKEKGHIQ